MRPKLFFDDGLFFMSFSIALGVIALIIPARGATRDPACMWRGAQMTVVGGLRAVPDLSAALVVAPAVSACTGMSDTGQRTLTGAAGSPKGRGRGGLAGLAP